MSGNPKLKEKGYGEEAKGRNAIIGGFKDKDSGRIISPMLTLQKPFSILRLTGMGLDSPICLRLKTTA